MFKQSIIEGVRRLLHGQEYPCLTANVLSVRTLQHMKKAMNWKQDPILDDPSLFDFDYLEDLNDRRLRDAEVIGAACANGAPSVILEIGTAYGKTTAMMAKNARHGVVHTVNIPPEEIAEGGRHITGAVAYDDIGRYYREAGCDNVRQILANTRDWTPDIGMIDVAFIDGCHDAEFVVNDTVKVLSHCHPGSVIIWHDFNPSLAKVYPWIREVCTGIERLYAAGCLRGKILHLQDSWTGLYTVPES